MFKTFPGSEREALGFKTNVVLEFNFLIKEYGYRCTEATDTFVRFESEKVFVNVYHGRSSYEVGFEIGLLENKHHGRERKVTLGPILKAKGITTQSESVIFQASTKSSVERCVKELAQVIRENITDALFGDTDTFEQLFSIQEQMSDQYLQSIELAQQREHAEEAWIQKDFRRVIELYQSMDNFLKPSEIKRLEYAKKHIG